MIRWSMLIIAMGLAIDQSNYRVTLSPHPENAEVRIIIWSDSNDEPYFQIDSVPVSGVQSAVTIPRHYLPKGSYVIQAELLRWFNCELIAVDSSPTVIIHQRGD